MFALLLLLLRIGALLLLVAFPLLLLLLQAPLLSDLTLYICGKIHTFARLELCNLVCRSMFGDPMGVSLQRRTIFQPGFSNVSQFGGAYFQP